MQDDERRRRSNAVLGLLSSIWTWVVFIFVILIVLVIGSAIYYLVFGLHTSGHLHDLEKDHAHAEEERHHMNEHLHLIYNKTCENHEHLHQIKYKVWHNFWLNVMIREDVDYIRNNTRIPDEGCPVKHNPQCTIGASTAGFCDGEMYHAPTEQCRSMCYAIPQHPSEWHHCDGCGDCVSEAPCRGDNCDDGEDCPELDFGNEMTVANTTICSPTTSNCIYFYTDIIDVVAKQPCFERNLWRDRCRSMLSGPLADCMDIEVMCVNSQLGAALTSEVSDLLEYAGYVKNKSTCSKCDAKLSQELVCTGPDVRNCSIVETEQCECTEELELDTDIFFGCAARFSCATTGQDINIPPMGPLRDVFNLKQQFGSLKSSIIGAAKGMADRVRN